MLPYSEPDQDVSPHNDTDWDWGKIWNIKWKYKNGVNQFFWLTWIEINFDQELPITQNFLYFQQPNIVLKHNQDLSAIGTYFLSFISLAV